jgi:hypothetical protein
MGVKFTVPYVPVPAKTSWRNVLLGSGGFAKMRALAVPKATSVSIQKFANPHIFN